MQMNRAASICDVRNSLGWRPSLPDYRDLGVDSPEVSDLLERLKARDRNDGDDSNVDLREFFLPIREQLEHPGGVAQAAVDLIEYFDVRCLGRMVRLSSQFVLHSARAVMDESTPESVDFRSIWKAVRRFGVPDERLWRPNTQAAGEEPPSYLYAFDDACRSLQYIRLDRRNQSGKKTLRTVRKFLNAGFPVAFGIGLPESSLLTGTFLYRPALDVVARGHALVAVGYDDRRLCATRGALLVRNSWGTRWGDSGYGWLPYSFVEQQLAVDFWTVVRDDWIDSRELSRPALG
ncbi:MAG: C1 family peptidase [Planctomycetales bacterium]|nr:C1 family peptidase [Planctomycetales bacterium]